VRSDLGVCSEKPVTERLRYITAWLPACLVDWLLVDWSSVRSFCGSVATWVSRSVAWWLIGLLVVRSFVSLAVHSVG
jgi:hypothetical protein